MVAVADPSGSSIRLPCRFGQYLLFDRIGQGGMAEILLARGRTQLGVDRHAVVKLILPRLAADERFATMLVSEAKLAAQLSHANVVQTYDLGREQGRLYIAMEYVEGFDLNDVLKRCTKARLSMPAEFAFYIVGETLRALDYAHRRTDAEGRPLGIVHCDVSPSNVLLSLEGEVKLCDFGVARAVNAAELPPAAIEGKAGYMSPEHARGEPFDARADVFAVSVVLWELLAGRRMVKPTADQDAITIARAGVVPPLPDRGLPDYDEIARIVMSGLEPDRDARYGSALEMARELDTYAMKHRLLASPLRLGEFLMQNFGDEVVRARRARERAAIALEKGPLVSMSVVASESASAAGSPGAFDDVSTQRDAVGPGEVSALDDREHSDFRRKDDGRVATAHDAQVHDGPDAGADAALAPLRSTPASTAGPFEPAAPATAATAATDAIAATSATAVAVPRRSAAFFVVAAMIGVVIAIVAGLAGWWLARR